MTRKKYTKKKLNMKERILLLSPHTDDVELGCGASVAKFQENGSEIMNILGSSCKESVPNGFKEDAMLTEYHASMSVLGIVEKVFLDLPVRHFPALRQEILEAFVKINREYKPTMVLLPCSNDIHQDHQTFYNEGLRAFKFCKVLGYELPWNMQNSTHSCHVIIEQKHLDKKLESMACYNSQQNRPYFGTQFISHLAKIRGVQAGGNLAESFELIKWYL